MATAGDVNGDGYSDVLVGAPGYDKNGLTDEGRAFIYLGSPGGLFSTPAWTADGGQASARFGQSVATTGDVDGDGYADVIVGAPRYSSGQTEEGLAFVYSGSAAGLPLAPTWTLENNIAGALLGSSVATAGDVNGDGYADVIVGAIEGGGYGYAFLYPGSSTGLIQPWSWTAQGYSFGTWFGYSVGTAGDVNGDGYADVIIGEPIDPATPSVYGRAVVYLGSASGLLLTPAWTRTTSQEGSSFGATVASAGDVNGDGYADIIAGALHYGNDQVDEGTAYLFYGNGGPGPSVHPTQRQSSGYAPVSAGGRSYSPGSFLLSALGRTPFGRSRARLEWEVKPLGVLFDGSWTVLGAASSETGTSGVNISELVVGLDPGLYHWRVRMSYDRARTPLAQASRWFTMPWNGWQEMDLTLMAFLGGRVCASKARDRGRIFNLYPVHPVCPRRRPL